MQPRPRPPIDRIVRKQGPDWLIDLLVMPPAWLRIVVVLAVVVVLALTARSLARRDWHLDDDVQSDILDNAVTIVSIIAATLVVSSVADIGYLADVVGGFVGGFATSRVVVAVARSGPVGTLRESVAIDAETEFAGAWIVVGVVAFGVTSAFGTESLMAGDFGLYALVASVLLSFYNLGEATNSN